MELTEILQRPSGSEITLGPGQKDPEPEQEKERDDGHMSVEDRSWSKDAHKTNHRARDDGEEPIDRIDLPSGARQQSDGTLAEQGQNACRACERARERV